jgi:SAM-dependent methyltransferase
MRDYLKKYLEQQHFAPGALGLLINPFYFARKGLHENIKALSSKIQGGRLLDVGCGRKPYKEFFNVCEYVGMDVDQSGHSHVNEEIDIFYDGKNFPLQDEEFDHVLSSQVFEHVFTPSLFISEINRVLKPGGTLILSVPFVWDEHEQPYDYARYSSYGLKTILQENNFTIVESIKSVDDFRVIAQLLNAYLFKTILPNNKWLNIIFTLAFIAPVNIWGVIISKIIPKNQDLYLDNIILAKKV